MATRTKYTDDCKSFGTLFQDLKQSLVQSEWYREEEWHCNITQTDVQLNFILEKPTWAAHGVSLLTWIGGHELRSNNYKVALYIEPELPHRKVLCKALASQLEAVAAELNYHVSANKTYMLIKKVKPLIPSTHVRSLLDEFENLRQAADIIESVLKELEVNAVNDISHSPQTAY